MSAPAARTRELRLRRLRAFWSGRDLGIVYALVVTVASVVVALQPAAVSREWLAQSSTNLDNMSTNPVRVLALSAFVVAPLWFLVLLIPLVIAYGAVQRWLGRLALVITVVFSHVGATLLGTIFQTVELTGGWVAPRITGRLDVGVSYGLAGALGLLLVHVPGRYRLWYGVASVLGVIALIVFSSTFSIIGHGGAWLIGLGLAWLVYASARSGAQQNASTRTSGRDR
jgi:hypothetical protein